MQVEFQKTVYKVIFFWYNRGMKTFVEQRDNVNTLKLRAVMQELPEFCSEFFVGIGTRTSVLTRLNYAYDLRTFFNYLIGDVRKFKGETIDTFGYSALSQVTSQDIENYVDHLSLYFKDDKERTNTERGKYRKLAAVRSLFKYLYNHDKIDQDVASKVALPKIHEKEIIRLDVNEVADLLDEVESGDMLSGRQKAFHQRTNERDTAILTLFLGTGIRISELVGLNIKDVNFENNSFTVTRKGGNRVVLYFSDEVAVALLKYLEIRNIDKDIPEDENALFLSLQKRRISVRATENLVKKYAKLVTPLKKITPHKLRSTYGTSLYRETHDIYVVAEVLGHKDINTTKKHDAALSDDIKREASTKVTLRDPKDE